MALQAWIPFFSAAATASAALVGLIIVAMSVNVEAIVAIPAMPSRASSTIANVAVVLIVSVIALVPVVTRPGLGLVLLVVTLPAGALAVDAARRLRTSAIQNGGRAGRTSAAVRGVFGIVPLGAALVAVVLLLLSLDEGLVAISVAFVLAFVESIVNAWVLMIEIRR